MESKCRCGRGPGHLRIKAAGCEEMPAKWWATPEGRAAHDAEVAARALRAAARADDLDLGQATRAARRWLDARADALAASQGTTDTEEGR